MTAADRRLPPFFDWIALDAIGSTNEEAKRRAKAGAAAGVLVTARCQTAGRGRQGRSWISGEGNLLASFVLRPDCQPAVAAQLSFVAALAVAETVEAYIGESTEVRCKWPNDVLVGGKKIAGILLESEPGHEGLAFVVIGIGINLVDHPKNVSYAATDLAAAGAGRVEAESFLIWLCARLHAWLTVWRRDGFASVRGAWIDRAAGLGSVISVTLPREVVRGRFLTLDDVGALVLGGPGGERRTISAGDVNFMPTGADA
ncbi:MAG: biotin--[acetyl-CoA-carboxylase] ligase [Alphaproteobacteria bacterium]|nr:biotin--[acetyl-CoA-carboxylase] ligase [Alphaproteobacteria bacterium]